MIALDDMERVASDFFGKYCEPDVEADMDALIDYVTTLSKIHGKRISIFTVPETVERERYTRVDFGFGQNAKTRKGWGDDLHERREEPNHVL